MSFFWSSKPSKASSSSSAPASAAALLERAHLERAARERDRSTSSAAGVISRFILSACSRRISARALRADLLRRCSDLQRVSTLLLTAKGLPFHPPVSTVLLPLLARFIASTCAPFPLPCSSREDDAAVAAIQPWLTSSLTAEGDASLPNAFMRDTSSVGRVRRLGCKAVTALLRLASRGDLTPDTRACCVRLVMALCGMGDCTTSTVVGRGMHAALRCHLLSIDAVKALIRPALCRNPCDASLRLSAITQSERCISMDLIHVAAALLTCEEAPPAAAARFVTDVLSIPMLYERCADVGEAGGNACAARAAATLALRVRGTRSLAEVVVDTLTHAADARAPLKLLAPFEFIHDFNTPPPVSSRRKVAVEPAVAPRAAAAASASSSSRVSAPFPLMAGVAPAFVASAVAAAPVSSPAAGAVCSPLRATMNMRGAHAAWLNTPAFAALCEWPPATLTFANVLQLLTLPASPPHTLISSMDEAHVQATAHFLASMTASLPVEWLHTPSPMAHTRSGVIPMPPMLITQLRRLSSGDTARALARACTVMRPTLITQRRLLAPPEDDPERAKYDTHVHTVSPSAAARADTHLAESPSVWRSMWEGSKLALRALTRGRPAPAGSSATTAASPSLPAVMHTVSAGTTPFDTEAFMSFCELYALCVAPRPTAAHSHTDADNVVGSMYLLNALAFTPSLDVISRLWAFIVEVCDPPALVHKYAVKSTFACTRACATITLFASCLAHMMLVVDDMELYLRSVPLPLRELRHAVRLLRDMLAHGEGIGVAAHDADIAAQLHVAPSLFWTRFSAAATSCLRSLYDRHCQRPLGPADMWVVDLRAAALPHAMLVVEGGRRPTRAQLESESVRRLLPSLPFAVTFDTRATLFESLRAESVQAHQVGVPQVRICVHRTRVFETAYAALKDVRGDALKRKVYVSFINAEGMEESGIDAGGLFKECWTALADVVFNPSYGLWSMTENGELYPNPASHLCSDIADGDAFEFIGRVLGKALYEGITVGPQFARFFLHKLLGRGTNLHHLSMLDPELYKSMMFLKTYDGDVTDLALSFTVAGDLLGTGAPEVELVPGGRDMPVTTGNRMRYIHMVADWRLNKSIHHQTTAFMTGLLDVIPRAWLAPFSAPELQVLVSGSLGGIDVDDLARHATYDGYWVHDPTIRAFWSVVAACSDADKAALLRFVTSCERAPPLGFKQLEPRFCVRKQMVTGGAVDAALPSSSTCFHVLKLPPYSSARVLRDKLLTAIHAGAGFELT